MPTYMYGNNGTIHTHTKCSKQLLFIKYAYNQNLFFSPFCHKQKEDGFKERNNDGYHSQSWTWGGGRGWVGGGDSVGSTDGGVGSSVGDFGVGMSVSATTTPSMVIW